MAGSSAIEQLLAELWQMWRAGRPDAVEAALARHASIARLRLTLDAVRYIRSFRQDKHAQPMRHYRPIEQLIVLNAILDFGDVDAARAFVAATEATPHMPAGLIDLRSLLGSIAGSVTPLTDDPAADVQIVAVPDATCVLFVFTDINHCFHTPIAAIHPLFHRLGFSLVYLRDFHRMFYLGGIRSLGDGYRATIRELRRIAQTIGAPRIACVGTSGGSYGAIRVGLDLRADAVLSIAGPTVIDESIPMILERERQRGLVAEPIDTTRLDLAALYASSATTPQVRLLFGADNEQDRREAVNMSGLPTVELCPIPGVWQHAVLPYLLREDALDRHLHWLIGQA